jgi:hypothetical protein
MVRKVLTLPSLNIKVTLQGSAEALADTECGFAEAEVNVKEVINLRTLLRMTRAKQQALLNSLKNSVNGEVKAEGECTPQAPVTPTTPVTPGQPQPQPETPPSIIPETTLEPVILPPAGDTTPSTDQLCVFTEANPASDGTPKVTWQVLTGEGTVMTNSYQDPQNPAAGNLCTTYSTTFDQTPGNVTVEATALDSTNTIPDDQTASATFMFATQQDTGF